MDKLKQLTDWINESNNIVFFGGAGVSTESGVPDFRSKDGLYNQRDVRFEGYSAEYLLSHTCLEEEPKVFYEFYRQKMNTEGVQPNAAHNFLAKLEKIGKLKAVVTQNIDGLHQKAGSKIVYELHGTTLKNYCSVCGRLFNSESIFKSTEPIPKCLCGGKIRPYVTLYEEQLPSDSVEGAIKTGAGLSVLGGEFANFANPMQMMYEGLNDMEGLQDRMVNMFGNMASFNEKTGQIDISALNKQRMKAASDAMGVDYGEMLNLAMNNQRGKMVENQLSSTQGLSKDTISYIKNIAQLDDKGKAYVDLGDGKKTYVKDLNEGNKEALQKESEKYDMGKDAKMGDIYNETRDMYDKLDQIMNYLSTKLGVWVAKIAGINEFTGNNSAEEYWDNLSKEDKNKLAKKYGSKEAAKAAIATGSEDEAINKWYGGKDIRDYFEYNYGDDSIGDKTAAKSLHYWFANENKNVKAPESKVKEIQEFIKKQEEEKKKKKEEELNNIKQDAIGENYIQGKPHQLGGEIRNVEGGEAILNRKAVDGVGVDNIAKFNSGNFTPIRNTSNALNTMNVAPTHSPAIASSYSQKLSFEPMNINLNGKFELSSNGKNKSFNLDELDKNELKKIVMSIVNDSVPQINRQMMTLRDKGYNMGKDPFRGSGGYARP